MQRLYVRKTLLASAIGGLLLASSQIAAIDPIQDMFATDDFKFDTIGTRLELTAPFDFEHAEIRIRKRGDTDVWSQSFGPGRTLQTDLEDIIGGPLLDSRYTYEIRFVLAGSELASLQKEGGEYENLEPLTFLTTGRFNIDGGEISQVMLPGQPSPRDHVPVFGLMQSSNEPGNIGTENVTNPGSLAIGGYGVFGSSSTSDVIPGKVRILPQGTGSSAYANLSVQSFAANNDPYAWHLGTQGGDLGLQRQRTTGGSKITVLGIEEDAPANSLIITDSGRIGMGTNVPSSALTVTDGSLFPEITLRHPSAPSAVGIATDAQRNLRFRNPAGSTRMIIGATGRVGIGTVSPATLLHVRDTQGDAKILLEETQSIDINQQFTMRSNGNTGFVFQNTRNDTEWQFRTGGAAGSSTAFLINYAPSPGPELSISSAGNLFLKGTVSGGSSRATKTNIVGIDSQRALESLMNLELHEWSYSSAPERVHLGPMAEDFHEMFGYGGGPTHIAPSDLASLALVAAQELIKTNRQLEDRIRKLELNTEG